VRVHRLQRCSNEIHLLGSERELLGEDAALLRRAASLAGQA